jgi:hypothetical protein
MYVLSRGLLIKLGSPLQFWMSIGKRLLALWSTARVTRGNGLGSILVGITYWFAYLRKPEARSRTPGLLGNRTDQDLQVGKGSVAARFVRHVLTRLLRLRADAYLCKT